MRSLRTKLIALYAQCLTHPRFVSSAASRVHSSQGQANYQSPAYQGYQIPVYQAQGPEYYHAQSLALALAQRQHGTQPGPIYQTVTHHFFDVKVNRDQYLKILADVEVAKIAACTRISSGMTAIINRAQQIKSAKAQLSSVQTELAQAKAEAVARVKACGFDASEVLGFKSV